MKKGFIVAADSRLSGCLVTRREEGPFQLVQRGIVLEVHAERLGLTLATRARAVCKGTRRVLRS